MNNQYNILNESKNPVNVLQYSTQYNLRNHYPSIIRISGNTLFCAFTHYGEDSPDVSPSEIWAKYSYNNGLTWGDEFKIIDIRAGKSGAVCPCLYKKSNGNIICITYEREDDATLYGQFYQYESSDNGLTWDAGILIYESSDYQANDYLYLASNKLFKTQTGRLILPFSVATTAAYLSNTACTVARHLYSDDEGETWNLSTTILQAAASGDEALIVTGTMIQMSDGIIVEIFRTRSRFARITKSTDNGATWTNPPVKSDTLIQSNADTYLYCKNDILYAFVSRPDASVPQLTSNDTRLYLDLWKSVDAGDTWIFEKNLLYDIGVHDYTEPICFDTGNKLQMFYSYYLYGTTNQDLRFERYNYNTL